MGSSLNPCLRVIYFICKNPDLEKTWFPQLLQIDSLWNYSSQSTSELLRKSVTISIKGRKTKGELILSVLYEKKRFFLSRANKTRGKLTLIVSDEKRLFLISGEKNQTKNNSKRIMWKKFSYLVRIGMGK
jgi:hypothetical protein